MGINFKSVTVKIKILGILILIFSFSNVFSQENSIPEKFIIHRVKKGEDIDELSNKYNLTRDQIEDFNPQIKKRGLRKRMQVRIPVFKEKEKEKVILNFYTIIPDDTKWRIAYENGISIQKLEELNPKIKSGLKVGQKIILPEKKW